MSYARVKISGTVDILEDIYIIGRNLGSHDLGRPKDQDQDQGRQLAV